MKGRFLLSTVLTVLLATGIIAAGVYAYRGWLSDKSPDTAVNNNQAAENENSRNAVEEYLREHISELSPEKEVLGGKFYITGLSFPSETRAVVDYEDGHIALRADVKYEVNNGAVLIHDFSLVDSNGFLPDNNTVEAIRQAFMDKYSKPADGVQVTIDKFADGYARGGVRFAPLGEPGEGGIFLAYEDNGAWELAFDGNGLYSCAEMSQYGFPDDMLPDCANGNPGASDAAGLANPASVYCEEQGGTIEIRTDASGGQYGVCKFSDGSECEEWAFYRGGCQAGE